MSTYTSAPSDRQSRACVLLTKACITCGVVFAMPEELYERRKQDRANFYCPNGHAAHFAGPTEADKLRAELETQKRLTGYEREAAERARKEAESNKFKAMAERSHKVRLQKRIAAGVCPCCTRSFTNLSKHMAHMHPNYSPKANE